MPESGDGEKSIALLVEELQLLLRKSALESTGSQQYGIYRVCREYV